MAARKKGRKLGFGANRLTQILSGSGPERKWIDINYAGYAPTTTAIVTLLNGNVPGATSLTHVGRKLVMKSVQIKGDISIISDIAGTTYARQVLVYDRDQSGTPATPAAITWAEVYSSVNAAGTVDSSAFAMRNLNFRDRFVVISDRSFELGPLETGATISYTGSPQGALVDYYTTLNMETIYNGGTAGTVADIQSGALWLLTITDTAGGTQLNCAMRVRFSDE